MGQLRN
ncbi:carboxypeptidase Taq (M32) metallopeptidase family protein, partial [Vibrio parahaemolyticus V-223/04]